jgi:hypothetical protein
MNGSRKAAETQRKLGTAVDLFTHEYAKQRASWCFILRGQPEFLLLAQCTDGFTQTDDRERRIAWVWHAV